MKAPFHHPHPTRTQSGMKRREFLRLGGSAGAGLALSGLAAERVRAQTMPAGPGAIRFAVIGDFGETLADQTFPLDRVAAMIRSWEPEFVVSTGNHDYGDIDDDHTPSPSKVALADPYLQYFRNAVRSGFQSRPEINEFLSESKSAKCSNPAKPPASSG